MSGRLPGFKNLTFLKLCGGPNDQLILEIAPTMRDLTHKGESYFRMPNSRALKDDGSYGGAYLWRRYWDRDQIELRKAERNG